MIQIIAMDFDWTLVDHNKETEKISPELIRYLNRFIEAGGNAGIVSGRQYWHMWNEYERYGFPWGKSFPSFTISREAYIHTLNRPLPESARIWNEKTKAGVFRTIRTLCGYADQLLGKIEQAGIPIENWTAYGDFAFEVHFKEHEQALKVMNIFQKAVSEFGLEDCAVHVNSSMTAIYYAKAGKGNSLFQLGQSLGVAPNEILALGDSLNDLTMLDGHLGFQCGTFDNGDPLIRQAVKDAGGCLGKGRASEGIVDILNQLVKENKLPDYF